MIDSVSHTVKFFLLLSFLAFSSQILQAQVTCDDCSSGVCNGSQLSDFISFDGDVPGPVTIQSATGAVELVGENDELEGYILSGEGNETIELSFEDINGEGYDTTLTVLIHVVNAGFSYIQGECTEVDFTSTNSGNGNVIDQEWEVYEGDDTNGNLLTTLSGSNPQFEFPIAGEYTVVLTATTDNGCTDSETQSITVGGLVPQLQFSDEMGEQVFPSTNDICLIPYCQADDEAFELSISNLSDIIQPSASISDVQVSLNGTVVSDPFNGILIEMDAGSAGYQTVTITTSNSQCSATKEYQVYFGSDDYYSTLTANPDLDQAGCPGEVYPLTLSPGVSNPPSVDYTLEVLCDDELLETYTWDNFTPPDTWNFDWEPTTSSCNCSSGYLSIKTTALHPCTAFPGTGTQDVRISSPVEAVFNAPEELCVGEEVTLSWPGNDQLNSIPWCDSETAWTITDEEGNSVAIDDGADEPSMSHTFTEPGIYEVMLEVENNNCSSGGMYTEEICVEPNLNDATLQVEWNLPNTLCEGDEFAPSLTPPSINLCSPAQITWSLDQTGESTTYANGNSPTIGPLSPGSFTLVVEYETECGQLTESVTFDVSGNPVLTNSLNDPFDDACPGEEICLDDWFCVEYNATQLSSFQMEIYSGSLSNCDNPSAGQLVEIISGDVPNPAFDPCDPDVSSCLYSWTAQTGNFTLRILAENDCGNDIICIPINIPEPQQPDLNTETSFCHGEQVTVEASQGGGTFQFLNCPGDCPSSGPGMGQYQIIGNDLIWNSDPSINPTGSYEIEYAGDCIESAQVEIELNELPEFDIISDPENSVCSDELVELSVNYVGSNSISACEWTNSTTGNQLTPIDCTVDADLVPGSNIFTVVVTDENGCENTNQIEIEELTQPFVTDCSGLQEVYCDNSGAVIDLQDLLDPNPMTGDLQWTLNGTVLTTTSILVDTLISGDYQLNWNWTHPQSATCIFEDGCSFNVVEATNPNLIGADVCAGETLEVEATNTDGIIGNWEFIDCPGDCPPEGTTDQNSFSWITDETSTAGVYELEFSGACLQTQSVEVEVFELPVFDVVSSAGTIICAGDSVDLSIQNFDEIQDCEWTNSADDVLSDIDCVLTIPQLEVDEEFDVEITDGNSCSSQQSISIEIQTQPFALDGSIVDTVYCDNSEDVITLVDLLNPNPATGDLHWHLNEIEITSGVMNVEDLNPGDYQLYYDFFHDQSPNCHFTDTIEFSVQELTIPQIEGDANYCLGEEVEFTASELNGFSGSWSNTGCPGTDCPDEVPDEEFSWQSTEASTGDYTIEFSGECLQTQSVDFTIYSVPQVSWSPDDASPCLNECLEVSETELSNYSDFGWSYTAGTETGEIVDNEICLENLVDPSLLEICLWAELDHGLGGETLTCASEGCQTVEPISSPGNYPVLPETACPGEIIDLNVDDNLYDNCTFEIDQVGIFDNCSSAQIGEDIYGTFADTLLLEYSGCLDTLSGEIFILQPPGAEYSVSFDPCVGDVTSSLINVSGDDLFFNWDIFNVVNDNFDFLFDNPNVEQATPNPISLTDLGLDSDSTFYFSVTVSNACESLVLEETVEYVAAPYIEIDVQAETNLDFCFPETIQFELFEFATNYIDSVFWDFDAEYGNASLDSVMLTDTFFPGPIEYTNIGAIDSVFVNATAWNQCGSDSDTLMITLHPPDVFLEMPENAEGVCPGTTIEIEPLQVQGIPWNGCSVTSDPEIPGLQYVCIGEFDAVEITIPTTTPPGIYELTTEIEGCGSDADVTMIEVFPTPEADFEIASASCTGSPVEFLNNSQNAAQFQWDFGDPDSGDDNSSSSPSPSHTYNTPGTYSVTMWAISPDGCGISVSQDVEISGPDPTIFPGNQAICSGEELEMWIGEEEDLVELSWTFSHPAYEPLIFSFQNEVNYSFYNHSDTLQIWEVSVEMLDIQNCSSQGVALVFVKPSPSASFTHSEIESCAQGAKVDFYNHSTTDSEASWDFGDPVSGADNYSNDWNPSHFFTGPSNYAIELVVQNTFGCTDYQFEVLPCSDFELFIPNAFTPDGDFTNEIFKPVIDGIELVKFIRSDDYTFQVFDRWGVEVFSTHDPARGWDGSNQGGDYYCQSDVYNWQLKIEFPSGRTEEKKGNVTLIR